MYSKLYSTWRREKLESKDLQLLEPNFYGEISQYVKKMREELRMLDEKALKYKLLSVELERAQRLVTSVIDTRYGKLIGAILESKNVLPNHLASEEVEMYKRMLEASEQHENLKKRILEGRNAESTVNTGLGFEKILVRFMAKIPVVVGVDMRSYGPFEPEDVATLPRENAEALVRQKVAIKITTED